MNQDKPRWQQRFDNYKRAYFLLQEYQFFWLLFSLIFTYKDFTNHL